MKSSYSKLYLFFWRRPLTTMILSFIKGIATGFGLCMLLMGCSKYQVVSEVRVNLYHLHNPKTNDVQVILTEQDLKEGEWYRLNEIKIITIDDLKYK